jgi:hypothetical protein
MTALRLVQYTDTGGARRVARVAEPDTLEVITGAESVYELADRAIGAGRSLATEIDAAGLDGTVDYERVAAEGRLLSPINHPDPAHLLVTGTGLTHLGSADARDAMHAEALDESEEALTDSMRMFRLGLTGGKPADGKPGVQPEWFYKGDGSCLVDPGEAFLMPGFALDGGEEPEIAGVYVVGRDGTPWRIGFAVGNEFADHVLEKENYLYLAHSKLRQCSIGPELRVGPLPEDVVGRVAVNRGGAVLWEAEWRSGEANMSHSVAGLEHHHFKYELFRRPGDVHVHFFGTAVLSYADGVGTRVGDEFEISAEGFGRPLRNVLERAPSEGPVAIRSL